MSLNEGRVAYSPHKQTSPAIDVDQPVIRTALAIDLPTALWTTLGIGNLYATKTTAEQLEVEQIRASPARQPAVDDRAPARTSSPISAKSAPAISDAASGVRDCPPNVFG